jgi:hypothetical protein
MNLLFAVAVVAGLGERPAALTASDPAAYSAWLAAQAVRADTSFSRVPACETSKSTSQGMTPMPPAVLAKATAINQDADGPVVIEHVRVEACGRDWRQNIVAFHSKSGGWKGSLLMPGDSLADYFMQRDVLRMLIQIAPVGLSPTTCDETQQNKTFIFKGAKVSAQPDKTGLWKEVWSVDVCSQTRPVEVTFTPKADGTIDTDYKAMWK